MRDLAPTPAELLVAALIQQSPRRIRARAPLPLYSMPRIFDQSRMFASSNGVATPPLPTSLPRPCAAATTSLPAAFDVIPTCVGGVPRRYVSKGDDDDEADITMAP